MAEGEFAYVERIQNGDANEEGPSCPPYEKYSALSFMCLICFTVVSGLCIGLIFEVESMTYVVILSIIIAFLLVCCIISLITCAYYCNKYRAIQPAEEGWRMNLPRPMDRFRVHFRRHPLERPRVTAEENISQASPAGLIESAEADEVETPTLAEASPESEQNSSVSDQKPSVTVKTLPEKRDIVHASVSSSAVSAIIRVGKAIFHKKIKLKPPKNEKSTVEAPVLARQSAFVEQPDMEQEGGDDLIRRRKVGQETPEKMLSRL